MSTMEMKPHWKFTKCGYTMAAAGPPATCPQCKGACEFKDVSCYSPECGGPGNIDPRL